MFHYPKYFTLKSLRMSQEVFTNVARLVLHLIQENKRTKIPENLIDVALAIPIKQLAQYVINNNIHYYQCIVHMLCCEHNLWELMQLLVIITILSKPITLRYTSTLHSAIPVSNTQLIPLNFHCRIF